MESQTDNELYKGNDVRRCRQLNSDPGDSTSLRSPLNKHKKEWEQTSPQRGRHQGTRQRGSYRSRHPAVQKATLAQFAPELMAMLQASPSPQTDNKTSEGQADKARSRSRKWSSDLDESFSLRSPLNKKQREWAGESPVRGRGQPGRLRGQYRSRRSVHPRPHVASKQAAKSQESQCEHPPAQETIDTDLVNPANDSRVRKRLWADEVDEAFVDGDPSEDEASIRNDKFEETPRKPLTEQQLARRQKDIDYGKSTAGYLNYCQRVPREKRGNFCPQTPDKEANHSRRKWDYLVHKWRRELHRWDAPCKTSDSTPRESTPSKMEVRHEPSEEASTPVSRKLPWSPSSSVTSTPSDLGYVTPGSSRANRSEQQLDEEEDALQQSDDADFPLGDVDFPPLTDVVDTRQHVCPHGAWGPTLVGEDEDEGKEAASQGEVEEDNLEESVGKLMITKEEKSSGDEDYMQEEPLQ